MTHSPHSGRVAITNVSVFNGHGITEPQTVVIEGSLIAANTEDSVHSTIDGTGCTLLPGLIDAHAHLHNEGNLQRLANFGITTALDMACWPASKANSLRNEVGMTDIRSAGTPVSAPGSVLCRLLPLPAEAAMAGPDDAEPFVQRRVAESSDYIKILADAPGPSQEVINRVTAAAHKAGKKVVAHATNQTPFHMAIDAGVDCVTHTANDKAVDDDMASRMVAKGIFSVPTLATMEVITAKPPLKALLYVLARPALLVSIVRARKSTKGTPLFDIAMQSVRTMHRSGVPILAGSDCHEDEINVSKAVIHGESLHRELELLVEAGLSTVEAIRAATELPAEHFGLEDRGVIQPGKRADLLLVEGDPIVDITNSRKIVRVWCNGIEVKRAR